MIALAGRCGATETHNLGFASSTLAPATMNDLPYRWCFNHNAMECDHYETGIRPHCHDIDSAEDYGKCDVRDATVSPKEGDNG